MSFARLAVAAVLAGAAVVPTTASAETICVEWESAFVCHDPFAEEFCLYGSLGAEAGFALPGGCNDR